ncbi:MAG: tRNA (adenosine(37)-N6)-threonylcarbamoyltransferase complex dimerization subunit type 1 TsaB [Desulfovibrionaceae bacterium]|nr:tRNA (adenosine(37)-N6)-threonylcarbamoyltransferase complex dimerization subunit type 1 TsaB [Desulfovibrionaceae bacterium]
MITLILYNSQGYISYALADDTRIVHTTSLYSPKNSTEIYMPHIEHACSTRGISPCAIGRILCTVGPTSFTATRLILSTALGIALPRSLPIASLTTLHSLALNAPIETDSLWIVLQAQKHAFYTQCFHARYNQNSLEIHSANEITLNTYENLCTMLSSSPHTYLIADEYVHELYSKNPLPSCTLLPLHYAIPSPFALYGYSQKAHYSTDVPEACYIRTTDAEQNIMDIAQKLGYSPQEIHDIYSKNIAET